MQYETRKARRDAERSSLAAEQSVAKVQARRTKKRRVKSSNAAQLITSLTGLVLVVGMVFIAAYWIYAQTGVPLKIGLEIKLGEDTEPLIAEFGSPSSDPHAGQEGGEPDIEEETQSGVTPPTTLPQREDPVAVSIPAAGVTNSALTAEWNAYRAGTPAYYNTVTWWSQSGMLGSEGTNPETDRKTIRLAGHSSRDGLAVFSKLHNLSEGDYVELSTDSGIYYYRAIEGFSVHKDRLQADPRYTKEAPGRLLVYTCIQAGQSESTHNNVVVFEFERFEPNSTNT